MATCAKCVCGCVIMKTKRNETKNEYEQTQYTTNVITHIKSKCYVICIDPWSSAKSNIKAISKVANEQERAIESAKKRKGERKRESEREAKRKEERKKKTLYDEMFCVLIWASLVFHGIVVVYGYIHLHAFRILWPQSSTLTHKHTHTPSLCNLF